MVSLLITGTLIILGTETIIPLGSDSMVGHPLVRIHGDITIGLF